MILALVFVLARNIVKLMVERRRGLPFARFRSKLVLVLLALTLIPSMLVLFVGSELIRSNLDRWFNAPLKEIVASANRTASEYYGERQKLVTESSRRLSAALAPLSFPDADLTKVFDVIKAEVGPLRSWMIEVYRVTPGRGPRPDVSPVAEVRMPTPQVDYNRASADRLAERVAAESAETQGAGAARQRRRAAPSRGGRSAARTARSQGVVRRLRLPHRGDARPRPGDDRVVRALSAVEGAPAAARGRLHLVLRHGHADDSRQRHVDGTLPRQADHATGADAGRGGA